MTLPVWPDQELPRPLRQGFDLAFGESRLMTQNDAGPVRARRRFSAVSHPQALAFLMTRNERARFERFYFEEALSGALPFLMPDFGTDGLPVGNEAGAVLTDEAGAEVSIPAMRLCLFSAQLPVIAAQGVEWHVSFSVEVLP